MSVSSSQNASSSTRGDEEELVPRGREALDDGRAVLVRRELGEEPAVVQGDAESILLLATHLFDPRERLPPEVLVRQLKPEALGERAQIRHRALRDDVVEIDADPHFRAIASIEMRNPRGSDATIGAERAGAGAGMWRP